MRWCLPQKEQEEVPMNALWKQKGKRKCSTWSFKNTWYSTKNLLSRIKKNATTAKKEKAAHQAYPQAEKIMCPLWFEEVYNRVLLSGVKTRAPSLTHYALACQKKKSQISRRSAHNTAAHPYRSCNTKSVLQTPGEKKKKKKGDLQTSCTQPTKEKRQRHSTYRPYFICQLYAKPTLEYDIRPVPRVKYGNHSTHFKFT